VTRERTPLLYLAPWVDYGGSDTNTLDWFRWIDRSRFIPSLITTQPSSNRRLSEVVPFASETWALPEIIEGKRFPQLIGEFISSRNIELVHIMNSRMGYDMLPDLRALKHPPKVVVQLHVEEPTRDGYVRYVTTRFGNLVDAFSVSSASVGDAVVGYGVPRDRVNVIPTGIDTDLFSRQRVAPKPGLAEDTVHLLFIARLVAQKDPLLMVEVARELNERDLPFCIHVIGGGDLEPDVHALVAEHRLQERVVFESPTHELRPWYAAADILLMTSVFEGVPVILYEALAMEVPIVAPALPGIVELLGDGGGALVARRDRAASYADALEPLILSRKQRRRLGLEGRQLVMRRYTVQDMARHHGDLYKRLLGERRPPAIEAPAGRSELRFPSRPARGTPRVSVVIPCFNHGRLLRQCVDSVRAQSYPEVEMIVVDDGSTDGDTTSYLGELNADERVEVLRMRCNRGPSAARNLGISHATGRYLLPVDADNLLLPDAIERLVTQLQGAGEEVGFIYQNCQYFGNREDYFEPPAYNPWLLTRQNYIDTCSLIDREVFDVGCAYAEDIVFGHEDWDFFLQLAGHGIRGEPARGKTLLYRKEGFTRSDLVEWTGSAFHSDLAARHPTLFPTYFPDEGAFGPALRMKARWAPALSLIALTRLELAGPAWEVVRSRLRAQQFADFEVWAALDRDAEEDGNSPPVRRLPERLSDRPAENLLHALEVSRGRHVVVTNRALPDLLSEPGSTERMVRMLERGQSEAVLCFADAVDQGLHPFALLSGDDSTLEPHSLAFSRLDAAAQIVPASLDTGDPVGTLARSLQLGKFHIEWRHLAAAWAGQRTPSGEFHTVVRAPRGLRAERSEQELRLAVPPIFPGPARPVSRWSEILTWIPACTAPLVRHRRLGAEEWTTTTSLLSPPGYEAECYLGVVHMRALEGTRRIMPHSQHGYIAVPRGGEPSADEMEASLGYADEVAFAMFEPLLLCRHAGTGTLLLVCGEDDPIRGELEWPHLAVLGYIDRFPVNPHDVGTSTSRAWLRGLIRGVDLAGRRHRVGFGAAPTEYAAWELGALLDRDPGGAIATWIDSDGRLHTQNYAPTRHPYDLRKTLRWVGAPVDWRGFGRRRARSRAVARRGVEAVMHTLTRPGLEAPVRRHGEPRAWLLSDPGVERHALFSAIHPVTADQLVTRDVSEARELGYGPAHILGYALALAPVTGSLARPPSSIPWGSRFGEALTGAEDPHARSQ
jgi:glycosyltransferase involved in cell wall biosynthesis